MPKLVNINRFRLVGSPENNNIGGKLPAPIGKASDVEGAELGGPWSLDINYATAALPKPVDYAGWMASDFTSALFW